VRQIRLGERRAVTRRLPRADVDCLLRDWSHVVGARPTPDRGVYRLTAGGWVGHFRTPSILWEVMPRLGWAAVERLLGSGEAADGVAGVGLRSGLASRLAELMHERATAGLIAGYAERAVVSDMIRGRPDIPADLRRQAAGGPGLAQVVDELTADRAWNGWPLAVAHLLLSGDLTAAARQRLIMATGSFAGVSPSEPPTDDSPDPRLITYRPLHDWCRLTTDALTGRSPLLNLSHLFEWHLARLLGPLADAQRPIRFAGDAPPALRPDFTVVRHGRPVAVWDAKWKPFGDPTPDDLHQVMAYAAALGAAAAGLLYPGRRLRVRRFTAPSGLRVTLASCRLTGTPAQLRRSDQRLRRLMAAP
jgi:hypothetical protein